MTPREDCRPSRMHQTVALLLAVLMLVPFPMLGATQDPEPGILLPGEPQDKEEVVEAKLEVPRSDLSHPEGNVLYQDTVMTVVQADDYPYGLDGRRYFNPDPERAVWMAALCPGLGQVYNRRYWKLPIIVGGFMGLGYATSWNNNQFQDYSQAYADLMDSDPSTNSYMNFFPPTTDESTLSQTWLQSVMKSRKDYYRRNRDLCIIGIVALYLVCVLDAYVDASLAHFDISDNLSLEMQPTLLLQPSSRPTLAMCWGLTF